MFHLDAVVTLVLRLFFLFLLGTYQKINKIQMQGRAKTPSIDQSWQWSVKRNGRPWRIICGHVPVGNLMRDG